MTTAAPDGVLTAADLLFGSSEDAHEALTRHVMSSGRNLARALVRLPRVTREAAVREAAVAAAGLLKVDLMDVLVAGWREHRDIYSAARRTLATPGSKELVGLAPHRVSTVQQPAVSILVDGHRVHTLQLGLSIIFEVTGLVAGISAGRLARRARRARRDRRRPDHPRARGSHQAIAPRAARCHGPQIRVPPPAGQRVPGRSPPTGAAPGQPPGSQHPAASRAPSSRAVTFPASTSSTAISRPPSRQRAGQPAGRGPGRPGQPGTEHPGRGEADHPSEPWWQKTETRARAQENWQPA